ncbi:MAG: DNA replication and repair protein RecF [Terrimicrobiaceae bacterium]|nr:DNA replication and repair protein RecF [Terrimicrobiaceae bacterium]
MLTDLRLTDFRCFERLRFEPAPGTNFLIGANAGGKTSILEAVCVVTRLQSPRTPTLVEVVREGRPGAAIDARIAVPAADAHSTSAHLHLRYEFNPRGGPPARTIEMDSVPQSRTADYLRAARVAWFSNDDMEIIRGSASKRRRYFDFLCGQLDPLYPRRLRAYDRALRSRNALLKDGRPRREIEAFDSILVENGERLTAARAEVAVALAPLIEQAVRDVGGADESVITRYLPGAESPLAEALIATRAEETRLRQTVAGPHRDDLAIALNGMDAARFASEGQQRTLALALKLAQTRLIMARIGHTPLLLIDDVFGELDPVRRQNLLSHLPADAQRLITATHLDWLDPSLPRAVFHLANRTLSIAGVPPFS